MMNCFGNDPNPVPVTADLSISHRDTFQMCNLPFADSGRTQYNSKKNNNNNNIPNNKKAFLYLSLIIYCLILFLFNMNIIKGKKNPNKALLLFDNTNIITMKK